MWGRINSGFVFAAVAVSLLAVMLLFVHLMNTLSADANELDRLRSRQAILASIEGEKEKMAALVLDNSRWDEAVRHAYGEADIAWVADTWSVTTRNGNADFLMLLDEKDKTLALIREGGLADSSAKVFDGPVLERLLDGLPRDGRRFSSRTVIAEVEGHGVAIAAAGPLVPVSEVDGVPGGRARMLVFGRYLDARMLEGMSRKAVVSDISVSDDDPHQAGRTAVPVRADDGRTLAWISWTDSRPGDVARNKIVVPATVVLSALVAACIVMMFIAARTGLQLRESEARERNAARRDALTGLPNRRALAARLSELLGQSNSAATVVVLMIDLDRFKDINDTYGHDAGDALLRKVSARFGDILGTSAFLARLGGDEFAAVLSGHSAVKLARERGEAMISWLRAPVDLDGRMAGIGASIGVAVAAPDMTVEELMRRADVAMYSAKSNGKNCLCFYEAALDARRDRKLFLANGLRRALQRKEISVAYQPIHDGASGQPCGVEALARWSLPEEGPISPLEFVAIAEESGLIDQLGLFILEQACRDAVEWGDLKLSVNVSPAQFRNPRFVDMVLETLERTGFSRSRLELEVTENYLIQHEEHGRQVIDRLREEGISVALDDFGTGYSSIGYLRQFRFDKLKLDRSLVNGVATDPAAQALLQATLFLARSLSLRVTVEGVEEEGDAALLRSMGCDYLQGYLFGRPQTASGFNLLLSAHNAGNPAMGAA